MLALRDSKKKTAKVMIVRTLGETWPLSAKRLYNALKKNHRVGFTYQAVYFALQELVQQGVLLSQNRRYLLSPDWLQDMSTFTKSLVDRYSEQGYIHKPEQLQELNFGSLVEAFSFCMANLETDFFGKSRAFYAQVRKLLPFPVSAAQMEKLRGFCRAHAAVILCQGNSLLDKTVAKFLKKLGAKVYIGVCCAQPTNTLIINDSIISMYVLYSKQGLSKLNEALGRAKKPVHTVTDAISKDIVSRCFAFVSKKLKVKLVINRDPLVKENVLWVTQKLIPPG